MNVALQSPPVHDVRTTVLDAAEQLGDELGDDGITMRHLSARAGVSTAMLYGTFRGKASLLGELQRRFRAEHDVAVAQASAAEVEPWARLHRLCRVHVEFAQASPWRYKVAFDQGFDLARSAREASTFLQSAVRCLRTDGRDASNSAVMGLWVAIHGLASKLARTQSTARSMGAIAEEMRLIEDYVNMLLRGLGVSRPAPR